MSQVNKYWTQIYWGAHIMIYLAASAAKKGGGSPVDKLTVLRGLLLESPVGCLGHHFLQAA